LPRRASSISANWLCRLSNDGTQIDLGYRLDLLIEGKVVVEVKAIDQLTPVHRAQLLSYLKLDRHKLGYLLNFNVRMLNHGICRLANSL
jgi:GxxExxY protein